MYIFNAFNHNAQLIYLLNSTSIKDSNNTFLLNPNDPSYSPFIYQYITNKSRRELKRLAIKMIDGFFDAGWWWILLGLWAFINLMEYLTGYRMFNDWKDPKSSRLQPLRVVLGLCVLVAIGTRDLQKMKRIDKQFWRALWNNKVGRDE